MKVARRNTTSSAEIFEGNNNNNLLFEFFLTTERLFLHELLKHNLNAFVLKPKEKGLMQGCHEYKHAATTFI